MVNKFLDAITEALDAEFGDGYKIYTEDVQQGLEPPCFLVTAITPLRTRQTRVTYHQSVLYAIQYFPENEENYRREIHQVISRLDNCLEVINAEYGEDTSAPRTENTDTAISDGVLSYFLRVAAVSFRQDSGDAMDHIESAEIEVTYGKSTE